VKKISERTLIGRYRAVRALTASAFLAVSRSFRAFNRAFPRDPRGFTVHPIEAGDRGGLDGTIFKRTHARAVIRRRRNARRAYFVSRTVKRATRRNRAAMP